VRKLLGNSTAQAGTDFEWTTVPGGYDFHLLGAAEPPVPAGWDKVEPGPEQGVSEPTPAEVEAQACAEICAAADDAAKLETTDDTDGIPAFLRRKALTQEEQDAMTARNARIAALGPAPRELTIRKSVERRARAAAAKKPAKPTKSGIARSSKANTGTGPQGMVAEILKAASRVKGASRAELNDLTKWKGAPWKWLFKNPKKNGYCDRHGYKFEILEGKDGETRYKVEKK
jgi:hypothetical protein